jgi:hypothetical protein
MESITKVLKHYRFNVFNFSVVVSPGGRSGGLAAAETFFGIELGATMRGNDRLAAFLRGVELGEDMSD